jgi:hypothetical protein
LRRSRANGLSRSGAAARLADTTFPAAMPAPAAGLAYAACRLASPF